MNLSSLKYFKVMNEVHVEKCVCRLLLYKRDFSVLVGCGGVIFLYGTVTNDYFHYGLIC